MPLFFYLTHLWLYRVTWLVGVESLGQSVAAALLIGLIGLAILRNPTGSGAVVLPGQASLPTIYFAVHMRMRQIMMSEILDKCLVIADT